MGNGRRAENRAPVRRDRRHTTGFDQFRSERVSNLIMAEVLSGGNLHSKQRTRVGILKSLDTASAHRRETSSPSKSPTGIDGAGVPER
jgi:hypothetical protein